MVPQTKLVTSGPWYLQGKPVTELLEQVGRHPTLGQRLVCRLGVKTGANRVFLDPSIEVAPTYWRHAVRGRDVGAWHVGSAVRLLWPYDDQGQLLTHLPAPLRDYFASHAATLTRRADYRRGPAWQLFRTGPALAAHRVVWADLSRRLEAVSLTGARESRLIPLNTCYVIGLSSRRAAVCLTAWLNTTVIRAIAKVGADVARGGYARFNARSVGSIPLPHEAQDNDELYRLGSAALGGAQVQDGLDAFAARILSLSDIALTAARRVE